MDNRITVGSLSQIMQDSHKTLAQAFLGIKYLVLADVSGSMDTDDFRQHKTRWERMKEALARVQAEHPGEVFVVSFSDDAEPNANGIPSETHGGTDLEAGLQYAIGKNVDKLGIKIIIISDGQPDDENGCLNTAAQISAPIDCIFIGPEDPRDPGRLFLRKLANRTKGTFQDTPGAKMLTESVERLMLSDGKNR